MMKRIPKGTLKVTTSSLDGQEPHERSKRTPRGKPSAAPPSSTSARSARSVRSFASPVRSRSPGPAVVTPTSPPPSSAPSAAFQFLRRPFGQPHSNHRSGGSGGGSSSSSSSRSRKSGKGGGSDFRSHSFKQQQQQHQQRQLEGETSSSDTGASSSSSSGDGRDGAVLLGICAPPPTAVTALASSPVSSDDDNTRGGSPCPSLDDDVESADETPPPAAAPPLPSPPATEDADADNAGEPPLPQQQEQRRRPLGTAPNAPPSKRSASPVDPPLLGIGRPNYDGGLVSVSQHELDLLEDSIDRNDNDAVGDLDYLEESEIVFESCASPASGKPAAGEAISNPAAETSTLFEQSWLSETDDLQAPPLASLDDSWGSIPTARPRTSERQPSRTTRLPTLRQYQYQYQPSRPYSGVSLPSDAPDRKTVVYHGLNTGYGKRKQQSSLHQTGRPPSEAPATTSLSLIEPLPLAAPTSEHFVRVFVLLLQPHNKIFELIQLTYPVDTTTVGDILDMIPPHATEPALAAQTYVGVTRPKKRSPDYCDASLPASYSSKSNGNSACLQDGDVVVALPHGYSHSELVRLAKKILANDRIRKLLERSSPSYAAASSTSHRRKHRHRHSSERSSPEVEPEPAPLEPEGEEEALQAQPAPSLSAHAAAAKAAYEAGMKRAVAHASLANAAVRKFAEKARDNDASISGKRRNASGQNHLGAVAAAPSTADSDKTTTTNIGAAASTSLEARPTELATTTPSSAASVSSSASLSTATSALRSPMGLTKSDSNKLDAPLSFSPNSFSRSGIMRHSRLFASKTTQPFFEPTSSSTSVSSSCSSLSAFQRARSSPRPVFKTAPKSLLDSEASDAVSVDGSAYSQWSNSRTGPHASSRPRPPGRRSFASFSLSKRASVHSATAGRIKLQRQRAAVASSLGRIATLLGLTLVARFYTDPQGYAAAQHLHQQYRNGSPLDAYDQPLGLLGGLQLFLLLHLLFKVQQSFPGGSVNRRSEDGGGADTPTSPLRRPTRRSPSSSASVGSRRSVGV